MAQVRKAGRPTKKTDARKLLIDSARDLFIVQNYDKVSTRMIAAKAGVNVAMIRYYFGSKEGLFESMARETVAPMKEQVQRLFKDINHKNFVDLMRIYYQEMSKTPKFPRLVAQVMSMPESERQRRLMEKALMEVSGPMQEAIYHKLMADNVIKPGFEPELCKMSFMSLMIFPFIAPQSLLTKHGVEVNESFLNRLIEHNIQLMTSGMLLEPSTQQGSHDDI
ncbi:TetR/AcrR family transcriptional regulator [uncultured Vibrio sp.]|uniref:TetR/AcrR family transcriptional regulator n=1 Tax=uncultured Vibrio sp. TaxID=114054 RepID=UPI000921AE96|nr:TetR family transcriptional regulator [uncultured Vibrio sp.]OIQ24293.1 MAG: TetR family transcriptional regulator [Vibrio sp. MedPE-SWchi]